MSVIYQSGYLTIKDDDPDSMFAISQLVSEIRHGGPDSFLNRLSVFSDTAYELLPRDLQVPYQNLLCIVFKLVDFYVNAEYHTSDGCIDLLFADRAV